VATVVDQVVGGLDGRPALFLLVVLALPFWDGLPSRVGTRYAELAAVVVAAAVVWFGVALLRPEGWWRAEIAYGIACGIAGTAHALLSRRRTVEP
jgi:CBS domain containing-hemolysin-like protein